jgi:uncharacterized protein (TIGR02246 family)
MEVFMRTVFKVLLLTAFFFTFYSFHISAQDMDELSSQIQQLNIQISDAVIKGDNEKLLSFYADDAISLPSYSQMMEGKDAIREAMMMDANSGNKVTKFDLTSKKIIPSGDLLIDIGTYDLSMNVKNMDQPINDHGKYLTIYQKQDDKTWKIKTEIWNSDINPWMKGDMQQSNEEEKD